ncbi:hypothetical protein [Chitinimonas sp. BJB300]|uniref:hypothetical protein n=1 Tax=Chitinimonas sp. BJB300 TaxID=1559339 RepID=UPI001111CB93|nr:hypothetical protein [Chitinimonas sp. BJB300]
MAFPLIDLVSRLSEVSSEYDIFTMVNGAFFIQVGIIIIFFLNPETLNSTSQYLYTDSLSQSVQEATIGFRLIGVGIANFGGGIIFGLYLLSLTAFMVHDKQRINFTFTLWWLLVALISFLIARSSLVAIFLSLLYILLKGRREFIKFISQLILVIFIFLLLVMSTTDVSALLDSDIIRWGFEFLFSYFEAGEATTASTEHLLTMYILPDNHLTYIFGDGRFFDPVKGEYYMNTDVGYLRLIFYVGIIGMITFIQFVWTITTGICLPKSFLSKIPYYFFIFLIISNLKGFVDATQFFGIFLAFVYMKRVGAIAWQK